MTTATAPGRTSTSPGATARRAGQAPAHEELVPHVVLHPGRRVLRRPLPRPDHRVVLLLAHPLDAVQRRVHRLRQLRAVLPGAAARPGLHQHVHLRVPDLGGEGRPRPAARRLPELADHRPRLPARGGVLPGARQRHRGRHPVQGAHGSVRRADQRGARRRRHRGTRLADRSVPRAGLGRDRRHLEGRRASRRSSTSPAWSRSRRSTSRRRRSTERARGARSGTSPCRSCGRRR